MVLRATLWSPLEAQFETSLTICIPHTLNPVLPFPDHPFYTLPVGHSTKRILIADDHESVLRGVRAMLEAHPGWEVCGEAVNGYEAITKAIVSWLSVKWRSDVLR